MENIKRYAHIEDNIVTNVSLWDGETPWNPECEIIELTDDSPIGPGWTRNGEEFLPPPPTEEELAMLEFLQGTEE